MAMLEKTIREGLGADALPDQGPDSRHEDLSYVEIADIVKMGSWRLAGLLDEPFELLESQIEGMWRELLPSDLSLFDMPQDLKYCDTADPEHLNPMSFRDEPWPSRGQPGYPRMQLENRCYESRVFRRLHMELVHRQDSIQVLHCVMYPRLQYDLPILSMDMVGKVGGKISLAVIDACPVAMNRSLPPQYVTLMQKLQEEYGMATNRAIPEWGRSIFSDLCVILRPSNPEDVSNFLQYALAMTRVHLQMARLAKPVQSNTKRRLADISAAHSRYCEQQLLNDKTTRVLESGFGKEFSDRYMRTVVFDQAADIQNQPT